MKCEAPSLRRELVYPNGVGTRRIEEFIFYRQYSNSVCVLHATMRYWFAFRLGVCGNNSNCRRPTAGTAYNHKCMQLNELWESHLLRTKQQHCKHHRNTYTPIYIYVCAYAYCNQPPKGLSLMLTKTSNKPPVPQSTCPTSCKFSHRQASSSVWVCECMCDAADLTITILHALQHVGV